jgi:predicted transcriptional regulator
MRLSKVKKPMMKILLVDIIYNKHMLQYSRKTIRARIDELIYMDRILIKTKVRGRQYVELSEKGRRIVEIAKELQEAPPPLQAPSRLRTGAVNLRGLRQPPKFCRPVRYLLCKIGEYAAIRLVVLLRALRIGLSWKPELL